MVYRTRSVCPECLARIDATVFERDGRVYMGKECAEHGSFEALVWSDAEGYRQWTAQAQHAPASLDAVVEDEPDCPYTCGLCDAHEGDSCTVVFHVTDRCNMGCPVCFAAAGVGESGDLSLDQIERMYVECALKTCVPTVQISGGEPTVRDDLPQIIRMGKRMGIRHIQVNTNGLRLASDPAYAHELARAGADLAYLQFDGLDDEVYRALRGCPMMEQKLAAIENCRQAGLGVLLVVTVRSQVNLDQLGAIVRFAKQNMPTVRGIHLQPATRSGRFDGGEAVTTSDVVRELESQTAGEVPASAIVPRRKASGACSFSSTFFLDGRDVLQPLTSADEEHAVSCEGVDGFAVEAVDYAVRFWRASGIACDGEDGCCADIPDDPVTRALLSRTLSISGMHFQDAWNLDLERLRGCCVHVMTPRGRSIPFCTYYLTSASGERLYGPDGLNPRFAALAGQAR